MMKTHLLIFLLFVLFTAGNVSGLTVVLNGTITDIQGSATVPGHKVYIKTDFSSPFHYYKTVYTDNNGYYADTVQNVPAYPVAFQISVYDCNNEVHQVTGLNTNSPIIANFQICVPPYSGCRAQFTYDSIAGLNYQFTDQSETNSSLDSWSWNFGDPGSGGNNLSLSQNPVHQYSSSGIYNVKLKIHAVNGCTDSLVKTVFIRIHNNKVIIRGHIINDLTNAPIPDQPVMINTTLIQYSAVIYSDSIGGYADTIPSVPDGIPISVATYDCNNILHSNTVFSSSLPQEVDFTICLNVQCRAGFEASQDSGNQVQNKFQFQDLSFGNPNKWSWTFGDGTSSYDRNPVHQYLTPGSFRVSLTITEEDSAGGWNCYDTTSRIVKTCKYFNLGGLLFAGKTPINNPTNTGDTGVAYLYRSHNKWVAPVDTARFTYLGYYTFLNVMEGSYIVKAGLTEGSAQYGKYLPVYNGDQMKWQLTTSFHLDHNIFYNDINLVAASDSLSGPAILRGSVMHKSDNTILPGAEVLLFNTDMIPIWSAYSNTDGFFEFTDLSVGTYNLYPEVTGKYARTVQITVDSAHPVEEGIQLEVFDHEVTGISPGEVKNSITVGKLYPNPVTDDFQFWIQSPDALTIHTEIRNLTGKLVFMKTLNSLQGMNRISLSLRNATTGMYFLVVSNGEGRILSTQKIIKN